MKIKVNVTQDDIDKGQRGVCGLCPIALALGRELPANLLVEVYGDFARVYFMDKKPEFNVVVDLPGVAEEFIDHFDEDYPVQPFTFDLEIPLQ